VPVASGALLRAVLAASLMAFALTAPTAYALAYNITVEDARIKVRFTYPPEVEVGSCFNVQIEVTALSPLNDLYLRLKIIYFYDSTSQTLFDGVLIDHLDVSGPGVILFRNIGLCIPSNAAADPWLEARLSLSYLTDTTPVEISNTFYLSTVRRVSYERLSERLDDANRELSSLRSEVSRLRSEVAALKAMLDEAGKREEGLRAKIEELSRLKDELEGRLARAEALRGELEKQLSELRDRYNQLLADNAALHERNRGLAESYATLQKVYEELRRDFDAVSRDLSAARALYDDLQSRHESLRQSYEGSVKAVGQLEGKLGELQRQRDVLEAMLNQAAGESGFYRSLAVGQGVGLIALGGGMAALALFRRRGRPPGTQSPMPSQQPPRDAAQHRPTGAEQEMAGADQEEAQQLAREEGSARGEVVQKVISGRRITIPSRLAEKIGISIGDAIRIGLVGDKLVLTPVRTNGGLQVQPSRGGGPGPLGAAPRGDRPPLHG